MEAVGGVTGYVFLTMGKGALVIEAEPQLPLPRGPLSAALFTYLRGDAASLSVRPVRTRDGVGDEDLQLALYCCYELHYRGFESVSATREWDADVVRFRGGLERAFTQALVEAVPPRSLLGRVGNRANSSVSSTAGSVSSSSLTGSTYSKYLFRSWQRRPSTTGKR